MYIIVKGLVNVSIEKQSVLGNSLVMNVATLKDGMHFGELAMMGTARMKKTNQE
jgi:CRP-like cAMP-binding protein